ncbi:MAG: hypothetical protein IPL61_26730 [Myxococcales bacterium]|nr:hypothetical protein [Myxococcales bacterium]
MTTACVASAPAPRAAAPVNGLAFQIALPPGAFAEGAELVVTLRDPSYDGGCNKYDLESSPAPCPPPPDIRETMVVTAPAGTRAVTVVSMQFRVGALYELSVAGVAADGCNRAYGSSSGVATAAPVVVGDLHVTTSEMAATAPRWRGGRSVTIGPPPPAAARGGRGARRQRGQMIDLAGGAGEPRLGGAGRRRRCDGASLR